MSQHESKQQEQPASSSSSTSTTTSAAVVESSVGQPRYTHEQLEAQCFFRKALMEVDFSKDKNGKEKPADLSPSEPPSKGLSNS